MALVAAGELAADALAWRTVPNRTRNEDRYLSMWNCASKWRL
jgi:hypothetical protein